jgi:hypothetical protein
MADHEEEREHSSASESESKSECASDTEESFDEEGALKAKDAGNAAYRAKDYDAAVRHYSEAVRLHSVVSGIVSLTVSEPTYFCWWLWWWCVYMCVCVCV